MLVVDHYYHPISAAAATATAATAGPLFVLGPVSVFVLW